MGAVGIFAISFLLFLCVPLNNGMPSQTSAKPAALDLSALLSNKFIRCSHKCRQDLNCLGITIFQAFENSTVETQEDIFWCRFDLQRRPEDLAKGSVVYQVMQRDKLARAQAKPVIGRGKRSVRRKPKTGKLNGSSKRLSSGDELDGLASSLRHVPIIRPGSPSQISEILVPKLPQPTLEVQVPVLKPTQAQATGEISSGLLKPVRPIDSTLGASQVVIGTIPALNLPVAANLVAGPGQETQEKILTVAVPGQPQATKQILLNAVPLPPPPQQIIPSGAVTSAQTPVAATSEPSIDVRTGLNELNASLTPAKDSSVTVQNASMTKSPVEITQDFKLPKNASHLQLQLPPVTFDFSNTSSAEINVTTIATVKTQDRNPSVTSNKVTASINPDEVKVHLIDTTPTGAPAMLRPQPMSTTTEVPLEPSNETTVGRDDLNVNTTEKGPVDIDFETPTASNASEAEGRNPVGANLPRPNDQGSPATTVAPEHVTSAAPVSSTSTQLPVQMATSTIASVNTTARPTTASAPQNVTAEDKTFGSSSTSTSSPQLVTSSISAPALGTTTLPSTTSIPTESFSTETTTLTTELTSTLAEESTTVLPINATLDTTTETSELLEESITASSGTSTVTEGSTTVIPETTTEAGTTTTEFVSVETSTIPAETSTILPETTTGPGSTETSTLTESTTLEPATTTTEGTPTETSTLTEATTTHHPAAAIVVSQNTSLPIPQDSSTVAKVNITITPTSNVSHIRIEPVVRVEVFNHPANLTDADLDTESGDIQTRISKVSKLVKITFNSLTSLLNVLSGRPTPDALAHKDPFLQNPPPVKEQLEGPHATDGINTEIPPPNEPTTEFPILNSTVPHEPVTLPEGSLRLDISTPGTTTKRPPGNPSKHDDAVHTQPRLGLVDNSDSRPTSHFTTGGVAVTNNSDAQRRSGTEPGVSSIGSISSGNLTSSNLTVFTENKPEAAIRTESKPELPTSPTVVTVTSERGRENASTEASTVSLPPVSSTSTSGVIPPTSLQIGNSTLSPPLLVPSTSVPPTLQSNKVVLLPQLSETVAVDTVEVSSILMPGVLVPAVPTILSLVSAATTSLPIRSTSKPSVPNPQLGPSEKDRLLSLMRVSNSSATEHAALLPVPAVQQTGDLSVVSAPALQKRVSVDDACVSEDAERFKREVTATAFSIIDGVPTLLSFVNRSNCIGTFSKNGRNGLRSLSSLFTGSFFITEKPRSISASFFFNNSLYLFDSGKEQTVARFVFDDKNGSYKQDEEYGCVSTERFLQETCGVNSPPPFAIKAVAQLSQGDSSCVVFDKSGKLLISPRATEDTRLLAKGLIALLDEELFHYIESVYTWLDEPDPEKVYVFGSDKEVYEIVKDASALKWAQGSYRVLPYDSLFHR